MVKKTGIKYIAPSESAFEIPNVAYRGEKGTYKLFEQMTPPQNPG